MVFDNKKLIVFLLCLSNVTISFNTVAVAAAIPLISRDLGLPDLTVAQIIPVYMLPYGFGALLYAPLSRYFTYRRILIGAMLMYALACFVSGKSHSLAPILIAQAFAGVAAASSTPLSLMVIGDCFEKNIRGRMIGIYFGASFLASVVGIFFMGTVSWTWLFLIPAVIGLLNVVLLMLFPTEALNRKHQGTINYGRAFLKIEIRNVFIFIFIISFLYHGVHKWYGVYLSQVYGFDQGIISALLILAAIGGLAGQQIGGVLTDKRGRAFASYFGLVMLALGTMLLFGTYTSYFVVAVLTLTAVGWTICHNAISTFLTDFSDEDRPIAASLNSSVRFISGGLGFSLSKFFVAQSFGMTFLVIGILMILTGVYLKSFVFKQT